MENKVRIIDIECNYSGQLSGMITEKTGRFMTHQVLKYNGRPMTATEMYKALKSILIGNSLKKQVVE
jgi:2-oxoglutarate ferredoxin oxidoreductase subunit alpha